MDAGFQIIIPTFKKLNSLKILLQSLQNANYNHRPDLIFVHDGGQNDVLEFIHSYEWPLGDKKIIINEHHLGLEENLRKCISLSHNKPGLITEDDQFYSPSFPVYLNELLKLPGSIIEQVAAFSLYLPEKHYFDPHCRVSFDPGNSCLIKKFPTRGFFIFPGQAKKLTNYFTDPARLKSSRIPKVYLNYSDDNWEKQANLYLIHESKFVHYPKSSLSTNMGDPGTHVKNPMEINSFQVNLSDCFDFKIENIVSLKRFDPWFEIESGSLNIKLETSFDLDLYGFKDKENIESDNLFSLKHCDNPIEQYGLRLKPRFRNVEYQIPGNIIKLGKTKDFSFDANNNLLRKNYYYDHDERSIQELIKLKLFALINRFYRK